MREAELVVRFAAGEPGSVAEVYRTYGRLVYAVTYRVLGDASLAEDATRRTFVKAWRLAASFDPSRTLGPWLASIAGRTAIDILHRRSEHRQHGNLDAAATTEPEPVRETHTAEQIYNVWLVRRAIDTLPDQDRELIRLQHYRQLTPTEIAARLGIPLGSVKSRSYRAHRRFAGLLGQLRVADRPSR
jgi:RNA polymerase sigma factor (sigma-70 family)